MNKPTEEFFIVVLCCLGLTSCFSPKEEQSFQQLAASKMNSVVEVINVPADEVGQKNSSEELVSPKRALGTGFLIDNNIFVTNYHVVDNIDDTQRKILIQGHDDTRKYVAHIIASSKTTDVALLKIDDWNDFVAVFHPQILKWTKSADILQGDSVWSIGNPYGLNYTLAQGIIASTLRQSGDIASFYFQSTVPIYPGNSGGPLFDLKGDIVGINSAMIGGGGNKEGGYFGLTIPSDFARKVVADLETYGKSTLPKIGILMTIDNDKHGVYVKSLDPANKSLATSGMKEGDRIIGLMIDAEGESNRIPVHVATDIIYNIQLLHPGDNVVLDLLRDDKEFVHANVTLMERNDN